MSRENLLGFTIASIWPDARYTDPRLAQHRFPSLAAALAALPKE